MEKLRLSVSEFIAITNQTLEYAYPSVEVEGEVSGFKVNQGKYVFFDLKDTEGTLNCFMMVYQLRTPIEDGMRVVVQAAPRLTKWGKFSLTVRAVQPSGEGALKKSFDLLKEKLTKEGLFAPERKRPLPDMPRRVAVISSTQAAGYVDFVKIINDRWGGMKLDVAHVQVQGQGAADQIVSALQYFNEQEALPDVVAIIRGGGSADDLAVFNDELLVRAIAASRVPVITGVGHEVDESLADLAADVRAATPSNAAQLLVPDREEYIRRVQQQLTYVAETVRRRVNDRRDEVTRLEEAIEEEAGLRIAQAKQQLDVTRRLLQQLDPRAVLRRGYAMVRGKPIVGEVVEIETQEAIMKAEIKEYDKK